MVLHNAAILARRCPKPRCRYESCVSTESLVPLTRRSIADFARPYRRRAWTTHRFIGQRWTVHLLRATLRSHRSLHPKTFARPAVLICDPFDGTVRGERSEVNKVQPSHGFMPISRQSEVASVACCSANVSFPTILCSRESPYRHCACSGRMPSSWAITSAVR